MLTKLWRKLRQQDRVEELEAEIDKLLHYRDWECVHCSSPAPLPEDHWQTCPNHPARKRVAELERELAEEARDTGNGPKIKPITEAEMATMDPPFPPEEPAPADVRDVLIARFDRIHELEEEFGDLLDQIQRSPTCSIGSIGSHYNAQLRVEDIARLRTLISKPDPEADVPKEPAPAEPTLREFLVEFRKWLVGGIPSDLRDWLDARLGKEESDG